MFRPHLSLFAPRFCPRLAAICLVCLPVSAMSQSVALADPAAIDAAVQAFVGAPVGSVGGARAPVDRRLRLADCAAPLALSWQGRAQDMVKVECGDTGGWRIFVPVRAAAIAAAPAAAAAAQAPRVARGQVLTIALQGRGFTVSQQGEALEEGAVGDWIRVRPEGQREAVRARIDNPGRVVIPLD